jgi:hypothetical protein
VPGGASARPFRWCERHAPCTVPALRLSPHQKARSGSGTSCACPSAIPQVWAPGNLTPAARCRPCAMHMPGSAGPRSGCPFTAVPSQWAQSDRLLALHAPRGDRAARRGPMRALDARWPLHAAPGDVPGGRNGCNTTHWHPFATPPRVRTRCTLREPPSAEHRDGWRRGRSDFPAAAPGGGRPCLRPTLRAAARAAARTRRPIFFRSATEFS